MSILNIVNKSCHLRMWSFLLLFFAATTEAVIVTGTFEGQIVGSADETGAILGVAGVGILDGQYYTGTFSYDTTYESDTSGLNVDWIDITFTINGKTFSTSPSSFPGDTIFDWGAAIDGFNPPTGDYLEIADGYNNFMEFNSNDGYTYFYGYSNIVNLEIQTQITNLVNGNELPLGPLNYINTNDSTSLSWQLDENYFRCSGFAPCDTFIYEQAYITGTIYSLTIAKPFPLLSLGDINNDNTHDLAALLYTTGSVTALVKDAETGADIQAINFDGSYMPLAFKSVPDLNGNGAPELAVLGINAANAVRVELRDSLTGVLLQTLNYDTNFDPKVMAVVGDITGNGHAEIAVLGIGRSNDNRRATLKDAYTGNHIRHIWFSKKFNPLGLKGVPDINNSGFPELGMFGHNPDTGEIKVEIKDTHDGSWLISVPFDQVNYNPLDFVQLPDMNQNGVDELAILGRHKTKGNIKAEVRDMATGLSLNGVWFGKQFEPQKLVVVPDLNNNGVSELGLLGTNNDLNQVRVELRDSQTGDWLGYIWSNAEFKPSDLVVMPDINSNNASELVFLGQRDSDGLIRAIIKDSLTNNWLGKVDFNVPTTITYQIGDTGPAGGIVFYVTDGGLHGLEAAPADQGIAEWGCYGSLLPGADGAAVGTGAQNTADILAGCSQAGIAAAIANAYTINGYNDWFLPSKDELNLLNLQQDVVGGLDVSNTQYWSSSEYSSSSFWAWNQFFGGSNGPAGTPKDGVHRVRAIRAF